MRWTSLGISCLSLALLTGFTTTANESDCLVDRWKFNATCTTPSSSVDGEVHIVFDSGTRIVGGLRMEKHVLPFHGRHLADRLIARTDPGYFPVVRIDCSIDSLYRTLSGVLQISKVHAKESRKKAKDYYNVLYQMYAVRER